MAKFVVGKEVYIPSRLLPNPERQNFALTRTIVKGQKNRSVRVDLQDEDGNDIEVASRLLHGSNLGITVLRLEDATPTTSPKTFVSLSCLTGRQPFAKPFSRSTVCADYLAPFQSIHSAAASLFTQSYFAHHLLNGEGVIAAFKHARTAVGAGVSFRHWRDGKLTPTSAS